MRLEERKEKIDIVRLEVDLEEIVAQEERLRKAIDGIVRGLREV